MLKPVRTYAVASQPDHLERHTRFDPHRERRGACSTAGSAKPVNTRQAAHLHVGGCHPRGMRRRAVLLCARARARACACVRVRACARTCVCVCVCARMSVCVRACARVRAHVCVRVRVRVGARARVCVRVACACACMHAERPCVSGVRAWRVRHGVSRAGRGTVIADHVPRKVEVDEVVIAEEHRAEDRRVRVLARRARRPVRRSPHAAYRIRSERVGFGRVRALRRRSSVRGRAAEPAGRTSTRGESEAMVGAC